MFGDSALANLGPGNFETIYRHQSRLRSVCWVPGSLILIVRARSRKMRLSILPFGLLGIASTNSTPPVSRLYSAFPSAICWHVRVG